MAEKPTTSLDAILKSSSLKNVDDFIINEIQESCSTLKEFFDKYMYENNIKPSELIFNSGLDRSYASHILDGTKNPSKDRVLALAIGAHMSVEEINRALKLADVGILYAKRPRDAVIISCINDGIKDVYKINEVLYEKGYEIIQLSKGK